MYVYNLILNLLFIIIFPLLENFIEHILLWKGWIFNIYEFTVMSCTKCSWYLKKYNVSIFIIWKINYYNLEIYNWISLICKTNLHMSSTKIIYTSLFINYFWKKGMKSAIRIKFLIASSIKYYTVLCPWKIELFFFLTELIISFQMFNKIFQGSVPNLKWYSKFWISVEKKKKINKY